MTMLTHFSSHNAEKGGQEGETEEDENIPARTSRQVQFELKQAKKAYKKLTSGTDGDELGQDEMVEKKRLKKLITALKTELEEVKLEELTREQNSSWVQAAGIQVTRPGDGSEERDGRPRSRSKGRGRSKSKGRSRSKGREKSKGRRSGRCNCHCKAGQL